MCLRQSCVYRLPVRAAVTAALLAGTLACSEPQPSSGAPSASASASASTTPRAPVQAPLAGERVEIAGGVLRVGSSPGTPGRAPKLEPKPYEVELGRFSIDRLPYPNDPARPPKLGATREEARRLCAENKARLCTELEWERACRGPDNEPFSTGKEWEASCRTKPGACASAFGVLGLGALPEWTGSDVRPDRKSPAAAVRGGLTTDEGGASQRCGARTPVPPDKSEGIAFRCCVGAPNAAVVKEPGKGQTFQRLSDFGAERLATLLKSHPKTVNLAKDLVFFREPDAANTVVARGPGDRKGFNFTVSPLLWNPSEGVDFLLVSARSGDSTSFVVAYHVLGKDQYQLAASFVMLNEPGPIAFAFSGSIKPRLHFSSCWGCLGETGKLLYRPPEDVAILQP